jgi:hypothetical protein
MFHDNQPLLAENPVGKNLPECLLHPTSAVGWIGKDNVKGLFLSTQES